MYNIYLFTFVFKIYLFIIVPVICSVIYFQKREMLFLKLNRINFMMTKKFECNFNWRSYLSTGWNFICSESNLTNVVQDKTHLSTRQLLNNRSCPLDNRSCPLDRWFIQQITVSTVLNNRALLSQYQLKHGYSIRCSLIIMYFICFTVRNLYQFIGS